MTAAKKSIKKNPKISHASSNVCFLYAQADKTEKQTHYQIIRNKTELKWNHHYHHPSPHSQNNNKKH